MDWFFRLDQELRNIIDKLAQFVARNGAEFEQMTKNKQRDNIKFSFLFGGEFFNYYQYKVTTEQAILKQKAAREHNQPMGYPHMNYGPHGSSHSFGGNQGYGPNYMKYPQQMGPGHRGPGQWGQHQSPMPISHSYPSQNAMPPAQTDLVALNGAKEVVINQMKQLQEQVWSYFQPYTVSTFGCR